MGLLGVLSRKHAVKAVETEGLAVKKRAQKPREGEEEEELSWSDQIFHQRHLNVGIVSIIGFNTWVDPDAVKAGLQQSIMKHPRFTSLQVADKGWRGKMRWVRTEVDLDRHVIVPPLEAAEADTPADKLVEDYVAALSRTPFDMSKPLWEFHILNVKTSQAEATAILWVHHSIGDGISFTSLIFSMTRKASDPGVCPTLPPEKKKPPPHPALRRCLPLLRSKLVLACNMAINLGAFSATLSFLRDSNTPLTPQPRVEFAPRRFIHRTLSLDDVKMVKNAAKATINDVVVGIIQAAVARYINRKLYENDIKKKKDNNLRNVRLRAMVLANVRASPGLKDLDYMMDKKSKAKWGNMFGVIILPFTVAISEDPLYYVNKVRKAMDRKKHSREAKLSFYAAKLISSALGIKFTSAIIHRIFSQTTMTLSNVVGPSEEILFHGHEISYLALSAYGAPHALIIHFQSYTNKITISLSVDERTIPDPHQLFNNMEELLKLMKERIIAKKCP